MGTGLARASQILGGGYLTVSEDRPGDPAGSYQGQSQMMGGQMMGSGPVSVPLLSQPMFESSSGLSCMDVAQHVKSCPICTHYYGNNSMIYIIIIFVLVLILLFLLKHLIDRK